MNRKAPEYLQEIRSKTKGIHDELEELVGSASLMSDNPDKDVYRNLLIGQYHFHKMVANSISENFDIAEQEILDWPDCQRIVNLESDLNEIGYPIQDIKIDYEFKSVNSAHTLGMCYVAEGSAMGNKLLYNNLQNQMGKMGVSHLRFLQNDGIDFGKRWREFLELMNTYNEIDSKSLLQGAIDGYKEFKKIFLAFKN